MGLLSRSKTKMDESPPPREIMPTSIVRPKIKGRMTTVKIEEIDGLEVKKRVTLLTFNFSKGKRVMKIKTNLPGMETGGYFVDMTCLDSKGEMTWDVNYAEPIDPKTGMPARSRALSLIMANALVSQAIEIATILGGFIFLRRHIAYMAVSAIFAGMMMAILNSIFHFTPTTDIHWFTSLPH